MQRQERLSVLLGTNRPVLYAYGGAGSWQSTSVDFFGQSVQRLSWKCEHRAQASDVVCPGGHVKCRDMTCCPLANKEYGCCPFPAAQCCPDHVHCCPHDMKCDVRHQACLKNGYPAYFFHQAPEEVKHMPLTDSPVQHTPESNSSVIDDSDDKICPDGHHCPSSFTCCKMYRGRYGCCPYKNAKCCIDGFHCCPDGSQCDPTTGGCWSNRNGWLGKATGLKEGTKVKTSPSPSEAPAEVADPGGKCPDGHPCLEKFTCCKVVDGGYGCCPYSEANCCTDLIHCCPKNTNCNTSTGTCDVKRTFSVPAHSLVTHKLSRLSENFVAAAALETETPNGICPDQESECPSNNTCCQLVDGSYGCCPWPQATCCLDHEHCCPHGYQCAAGGICERRTSMSALPILPSTTPREVTLKPKVSSPVVDEESVKCPDGMDCPDESTCCSISSHSYGCCPMPKATCCGDMEHCCPHGYWCSDEGCERMEGVAQSQAGFLNMTRLLYTSPKVEEPSPRVMLAP